MWIRKTARTRKTVLGVGGHNPVDQFGRIVIHSFVRAGADVGEVQ